MDDFDAVALDEPLADSLEIEVGDARFTTRRVVARGHNAWVFEAEHAATERIVALKVASGPPSRARLRGEAKVLGALAHVGGVVSVLDARLDADEPSYLALEWIRGRSLEGILTARGALPESEVLALGDALADALAEVHDAGYVHGDLAPKHVLVTRDRHGRQGVKLIDFGLSTAALPADRPADAWTAPEAASARSRTTASDVFGLGAILGCCLVGRAVRGPEELPKTGLGELVAYAMSPAPDNRPPAAVVLREIARLRAREEAPRRPASGELRRKPRVGYVTPVRVMRDGATIDGRSEDVSEGGLMLVLRDACSVKEEVALRFALPTSGRVVSCTAKVAWVRSHPSGLHAVGVELVEPPAAIVAAIAQYVALMGGAL
jgi:predicted Ser/Thr protein kinase